MIREREYDHVVCSGIRFDRLEVTPDEDMREYFPVGTEAEWQAFWEETFHEIAEKTVREVCNEAIREYKARMIQRRVTQHWPENWELESRRQDAGTYTDWADWADRSGFKVR